MPSLTRKIGEGLLVFSFNNIVLKVLGFLTTIILIRTLGMKEYGFLLLALSAVGMSDLFLSFGGDLVTTDISREIGKKRLNRAKNVLINFSKLQILVSVILFFGVFFSSGLVAAKYNEVVGGLVKILAFFLLLKAVRSIFQITFHSQLKFKSLSIMATIEAATKLVFVLILVVIMRKGIIGAMYAFPLSVLGSMLLILPLFLQSIAQFKGLEKIKENLFLTNLKTHGKWVILTNSLKSLAGNARPWLIQFFLGVEAVAIFGVAKKVFKLGSSIFPLKEVLLPIISQEIKNLKRVKAIIYRSLKYRLFLFLPISLIAIITAPLIFAILFPGYSASVPIFRIIALIMIINPFTFFRKSLLYGLRAQKYLFFFQLVSLISMVTLIPLFIHFFGLFGAGLEFLLAELFGAIIFYILLRKIIPQLKLDFRKLLTYDDYDKKLLGKIKKNIKHRIKR